MYINILRFIKTQSSSSQMYIFELILNVPKRFECQVSLLFSVINDKKI